MTDAATIPPNVSTEQALAALLSDGLFIDGDWIESKDQDPNGEVRLIQLADIGDGVFRDRSSRFLTIEKARELRCTFLEPGDILIARMPDPLGRACLFPGVGQPAVTAVDVCILRPNPSRARPEWLVKAINSPDLRTSMQEFVRGTTRQRISRTNLGILTLTVPPVEAQLEVAALIDRIESKRVRASSHAASARRAIERLRQAVLAAACAGRLTADWRTTHEEDSDDVGKVLEELRAQPGWFRERKVSAGIDFTKLSEIPESWGWAAVGEIATVALGGTPSRKEPHFWNGDLPWVSSGEVANCRIATTREQITREGLQQSNAKLYPMGTVLIAMIGEGKTRGQSSILDIEASTNQNVAGLLLNSSLVSPEYAWRWALEQYEVTRAVGRGGNQPALNGQKVRELMIPVPPVAEQDEIVRRVDELLVLADSLLSKILTASRRVDGSQHATLAKAFRAGLVTSGAPI